MSWVSLRSPPGRTIGAPVRRVEMDDHTAEYWARQLRIGCAIAAVVTAIGGVRVALGWSPDARWWLLPVAVAVVAQAGPLGLPWSSIVRAERRRWLLLWWYGEMPVLA